MSGTGAGPSRNSGNEEAKHSQMGEYYFLYRNFPVVADRLHHGSNHRGFGCVWITVYFGSCDIFRPGHRGIFDHHDHDGQDGSSAAGAGRTAAERQQAVSDVRRGNSRRRKKCKHCGEYLDGSAGSGNGRSRAAYILFGLFFGCIGLHNFYIGKGMAGMCEALIFVLGSVALGVGASGRYDDAIPVVVGGLLLGCLGIWVLCEILTVTRDADGVPLK